MAARQYHAQEQFLHLENYRSLREQPKELDLFKEQEYKYIKLFSSANPQIAQDIKQLKIEYANEKYSLD